MQEITATLAAAEEAGIEDHLWARFRADAAYRRRIAEAMRTGAGSKPVFIDEAHLSYQALDMQLFGPLDWRSFFNVLVSPQQWQTAAGFPWRGEIGTLPREPCPFWPGKDLMETHFAFFAPEEVNLLETDALRTTLALTTMGICDTLRTEVAHWSSRPKMVMNEDIDEFRLSGINRTGWYLMPLLPVPPIKETRAGGFYNRMTVAEYLLGLILYYQKYSEWPTIGDESLKGRAAVCNARSDGQEWCVYLDPKHNWRLTFCRKSRVPAGLEKFEAVQCNLPARG
jgi:hypothetical protein